MLKKLICISLFIGNFISEVNAQELQNQVISINTFIKKHSDSNRNYYAKINATQGNIYFYNGLLHAMELTFPVAKIDADKIKITKKGLTFYPNESGEFVSKKFGKSTKNIKTAWLNIINMSKKDKGELKNMMRTFILDYQMALKN